MPVEQEISWAKLVWSHCNMPRHSFIFWLALHNKLLTRDKLFAWKAIDSETCVFCNKAREDVSHLFFSCVFSHEVWVRVLKAVNIQRRPFPWQREVSWFQKKAMGKTMLAKMRRSVFIAAVYLIWRARNLMIFQQKCITVDQVFTQIREVVLFKFSVKNSKSLDNPLLSKWLQ